MLSSWGLFGRIAARKPLLSKAQIGKRIFFCKAYRQMSSYEWSKILFTDEMRIKLYGTRRAYVRRKVGIHYPNKFVCEIFKFGGRSLLVWGAIKEDGTRILLRCPPILNSFGYQCILDEHLKTCTTVTPYWCMTALHVINRCQPRKTENLLHIWLASTVTRFEHYREYVVHIKEKCLQKVSKYN